MLTNNAYQRIQTNILKQTRLAKALVEKSSHQYEGLTGYDSLADYIGRILDARVTLIDATGKVLGDSSLSTEALKSIENHLDRPEVQAALNEKIGRSRRFSTTLKYELLYTAARFETDSGYAFVRLALPLSEVEDTLQKINKVLVIALFSALIAAGVVSFIVSFFISRPIRDIAFMAQSIARSDFSRKIRIRTNDELEDLANAFNFMVRQVKMRINEVTTGKSRLEAVLLSMFEGVMVVDSKGEILLMNEPLCDFLGVSENPEKKRPLEVVRSVEIQGLVDRALERNEGVDRFELFLKVPEEKFLFIHATPVVRDGKTDGAVLVFHDVTELRKLERVRRDFVANVSHELRTPLTSIKGYSETLLDGAIDDAENARDFVEIIYDDACRLSRMVADLLDLSKIESEGLSLDKTQIHIYEITEKVITGLNQKAGSKEIKVNNSIAKDCPIVEADEHLVAQVLVNLIDNAIKYTMFGGKVEVSAEVIDGFLKVGIKDSGIGIPEEDLARIFERFYRVDKARSRRLGGTGLGLSIVKHIVQLHGGAVSVESEFNKGSVFSFTLPLEV